MADFDIQGARDAGVPESEIVETLAKMKRYPLSEARSAGVTDSDILSHLAGSQTASVRSRATQSLPRSLAFGTQFKAAEGDLGGLEDIEKGATEAGGRVTDATGSPALGTAVRMIPDVAETVAGGLPGKAAGPLVENLASKAMQSALKPTLQQLKSGDAAVAIKTMLDNGFNATHAGVQAIKEKIGELGDQIKQVLASSTTTVNKKKVASELQEVLGRFEKQVNPNADSASIEKAWTEFISHPLLQGKEEIPVQLAQELKQGTYAQLSKNYGKMGSADIEAQKGLARGLKKGIEEQIPGVIPLNQEQSALIKTMKVAERRALMELNKNPMGLSLLAGHPETFAAFMADRSAAFKSVVAHMLKKVSGSTGEATSLGVAGADAATQE